MGAVTVYYDNVNLFNGIGPVPLISSDVQNVYINKVSHLVNKLTLSGRLKRFACQPSGSDLTGFDGTHSLARTLINRLSKNFRKLEIKEDSTTVFSYDYAIIRSVSFNSDSWYDWVPYIIEIDCYSKGYFDSYGVIDPTGEFEVEVLPNNTVRVLISTSCKGINKTNSGFKNAQDFASSFGFYDPSDLDFYWTDLPLSYYTFFLISREETINRLTGEIQINLEYLGQLTQIF